MEAEHGFHPEQNLPIETKDVKNRLQLLDKELRKVLNQISDWVKDYNQRVGRIVFEPLKRRSTNISELKNKLDYNNVNWGRLSSYSEPIKQILGLIKQASEIKEQYRLIRHDQFVAREAKRLAREGDLMVSKGWVKVYEKDSREGLSPLSETARKPSLSELEEEPREDEVADEKEKL